MIFLLREYYNQPLTLHSTGIILSSDQAASESINVDEKKPPVGWAVSFSWPVRSRLEVTKTCSIDKIIVVLTYFCVHFNIACQSLTNHHLHKYNLLKSADSYTYFEI